MEFHLTYEGILKGADKNNTRAPHKHLVRKSFHPQLRRLWDITPHLKVMLDPLPTGPVMVNAGPFRRRREALPERFSAGQFHFVPFVTKDLELVCGLDILFLRPDAPGSVIRSGDLDNRLKTLLDALRIPTQDELGSHEPSADENPFYCLVEDDRLISHVSIKTDTLLQPTGGNPADDDSRLVIKVNIRPTNASWGTIDFLG